MDHTLVREDTTDLLSSPFSELKGLNEEEAIIRREQGNGNNVRIETGRTYGEILKANFLTFINIILFIIGILMILLGLYGDAIVSVGVVMMNVVVGIVQEFRAKYKLDKIALLTRPRATIIREGQQKDIDPTEIVLGDIIVARPGDQIVVDGLVVGDGRMDIDESLLTGESDLITKKTGDKVLSGSFCVTGLAAYEAKKVGADSFANKLTASAKKFELLLTPLQRNINFVVRILVLLSVLIGLLFGISFIIREVRVEQFVQTFAVIAGLVPAGLILMTTTAYAMGALRMTGQGALIQQSNAIESMSNVNVLCLDKTGTLTANRINLYALHPIETDQMTLEHILGDYARSIRAGNRTSDALIDGCKGQKRPLVDEIPFSSARKWSALAFDDGERKGTYILGAPEMLISYLEDKINIHQEQIDRWVDDGLRVLIMLYHPLPHVLSDDKQPDLPDGLQPLGLVSFSDELRNEAKSTLEGFIKAGIQPKIISGDNPHTVASLARQAGLPKDIRVVSGIELDEMDQTQIDSVVNEATVFGRIRPEQKEMLIDSLRSQNNYVAMIGDGVNDVLSLKKAQIGIAMESGSAATRGVADIVLLGDSFAALPAAFLEGQRILNGMQDIIRLFLTRAFYAALMIIGTAVVAEAQFFPFIPKHASLITLITVGVPTFALAAWARPGKPDRSLMGSTMHFVFPAAIMLALTGLTIYILYLYNWYYVPDGLTLSEQRYAVSISQTAMTTVIILTGLLLIIFVEPPTHHFIGGDEYSGDWRPTILAFIMLGTYMGILVYEPFRIFWEIESLNFVDYFFLATVATVWAGIMRFIWRHNLFERFLGLYT